MDIFTEIEKKRGMVARIYSDFRAFPESVSAHFGMNQTLILAESAPLSRDERELLAFKTSEANSNAYCASHHRVAYERFSAGATAEKKLRLELLERLAHVLTTRPEVASALRIEFERAGFSEREWQHAVTIVAYFNFTNRLAFAMGMELEEGFEKSCT